jgi:7-cyano-7-deazaguanine synthase in queuosine biosynthesis
MTKHVVLYSGGLDSFITLKWVRDNHLGEVVVPAYVPVKHRYSLQERIAVGATHPETEILQGLAELGAIEDKDAFIHHRNAFLILIASKLIPERVEGKIWLTVQKDELSIPDRTPLFMKGMEGLLASLGQMVQVSTPWFHYDKHEMVEWYLTHKGSVERLKRTHSCYRPGILPCGDCPACVRRYIAMSLNGIAEAYEVSPRESATAKEYIRRAHAGQYSKERKTKTLEALEVRDEVK